MIHNIISDIVTEVGGTKLEIRTTLDRYRDRWRDKDRDHGRKSSSRKDKVGVAQNNAKILLSGSPLVRAFTVIEKFMSNISPFPLSLDRIRDTRITIMTGRGGVVTGRRLPMRRKMDPKGNEDHVTTSRPQEVESNGQEDCWTRNKHCL